MIVSLFEMISGFSPEHKVLESRRLPGRYCDEPAESTHVAEVELGNCGVTNADLGTSFGSQQMLHCS